MFKKLAYYLLPRPYVTISYLGGSMTVPFESLAEWISTEEEWKPEDFKEEISFKLHYMTDYKYDHLPEFEGW